MNQLNKQPSKQVCFLGKKQGADVELGTGVWDAGGTDFGEGTN